MTDLVCPICGAEMLMSGAVSHGDGDLSDEYVCVNEWCGETLELNTRWNMGTEDWYNSWEEAQYAWLAEHRPWQVAIDAMSKKQRLYAKIDRWLLEHTASTRWPRLYLFMEWVLFPGGYGFRYWLDWAGLIRRGRHGL